MQKTIFITGGNTGIGLATAEAFAKRGVNVALFSRREDKNLYAKNFLEKNYKIKCLALHGDVTSEKDISKALVTTFSEFGSLHYAFNNAGIEQPSKPITEQTESDYYNVMDTNVKGVWLAMKHEIPFMKKSGGGAIVNTASVNGLVGFATVPLYVASKHAVLGLTKSVALEFAQENIRVNALCPGAVETDMLQRFTQGKDENVSQMLALHPMRRIAKPDEMGECVWWLCSDATNFMTGQALVLDGGWSAI